MLLTLTIAGAFLIEGPARERPRRIERTDGVDCEKPGGLGRIRVDQRQNSEQGRIVDEDVDRAKTVDGRRDQAVAIGGLGHVGWYRRTERPHSSLDRLGRVRQRLLVRPAIATRAPSRAKARAIA